MPLLCSLNCGPLKICPNLKLTTQLAYTVIDADCDCGRYLNVIFQHFYDVFYSSYFDYGII